MAVTVKERAEQIADMMREHFPHVHVIIAAGQLEPKWYSGLDMLQESQNSVHFIASDIPYKRSDYPAHLAMRSISDVFGEGLMGDMPAVIADMVSDYNRGA